MAPRFGFGKTFLVLIAAASAAAGCNKPEVHLDGGPSHHMDGGFRNPPGSPERDASILDFVAFFWRRMTEGDDVARLPPGHALASEVALAMLEAAPADRRLTWIGHAAFLIGLDRVNILTDPFFSDYASPFPPLGPRRSVAPGIALDDLPPIDAILISHSHYDSLDTVALRALAVRNPEARVLVPLGLGGLVREQGFRDITELDWYDRATIGAVEIQAIPAIHTSNRGLFDRNRTLWAGFAITGADGFRLVFAGDTAIGPAFDSIRQTIGASDLALVPIGAYEPRTVMRAVHATPEEAAEIARILGAQLAIGMHWGTIRLTDEPMMEPMARFLGAETPGMTKRVMRIGETLALGHAMARPAARLQIK
ncbi:MAG: MBL fold metallo-hydrolase [Alphaproteobacteria bacterium]|nr:MBL fold metallo-hydrolase [Alphaproteobacteria bacterium]MDP6515819.1 MBL fold metallo-hydrolase [Alphaproteobacteria bacterium]